MSADALLDSLQAEGFTFRVEAGAIFPSHAGGRKLSTEQREALAASKAEIVALLTAPKPFINGQGDLVIPFSAHPKYRHWQGGQSVLTTLREINAPQQLIDQYVPPRLASLYQYENAEAR